MINNMHLKNRYGEFPFDANFKPLPTEAVLLRFGTELVTWSHLDVL